MLTEKRSPPNKVENDHDGGKDSKKTYQWRAHDLSKTNGFCFWLLFSWFYFMFFLTHLICWIPEGKVKKIG